MIHALPAPFERRSEWLRWGSFGLAGAAAAFFLGLGLFFVAESLPAWRAGGPGFGLGIVTGKVWAYRASLFGALPMIYGTLAVSVIALLLAGPLGLGAALFAAEILPRRAGLALKTVVELLAGVPSVIYGLLGVLLLRQWIYRLLTPFDPLSGDTLLTGGVLLAVMILPTVTTLADDALSAVPTDRRRAARALGLSRAQATLSAVLPAALPGVAAALLLGLGRALGETIAVFLVIGRQDNQWPERLFSLAPLAEPGQTLTSKLGGSETYLAWGDPQHWGAIVSLALILLAISSLVTGVGARLARRSRGTGV